MKSILIVGCTHERSWQLSETLSQAGYNVVTAESGESAIELVASAQPDLVLMAIVMGELNGLQTAARLRSRFGAQSAPIILLGSVAPLGINQEPLASMVEGYLNVNVSSDELLACVVKHVA
jgi:CheY-like chemotaxis protein